MYIITVEDPNAVLCDSSRSVEVNLSENILVQIDTLAQNCSGSRILTATVTNPDPTLTYTYQWYSGSPVTGTRIPGAVARQHSISKGGTYSVRVGTNENVCESEATISDVQIRPPLLVELEAFSDCDNQAATIIEANVNQPNVELIWFDPAGIEIPGTRDMTTINVNQRGNFSVLVSNDIIGVSCSALESISLFDICPPQIFAHNAIRPASRIPENRNFYIHNPNDIADDFQVFIFNRWGEMIYESSDKFFSWNGTYRGEDVPVGTYPYLMRFKFPDDPEIFEKRGGVAVVR
jgi:gliding motility-associated-like protein